MHAPSFNGGKKKKKKGQIRTLLTHPLSFLYSQKYIVSTIRKTLELSNRPDI